MSKLETSWIFRLNDLVSGPMRKVSSVITGVGKETNRLAHITGRANTLLGIQKRRVDALTGAHRKLEASQKRFHERSTAAASTAFMGGQFMRAGRGALNPIFGSLDASGQMESFKLGFGVLLKSAERADERMRELSIFGAKTPFDMPEVVRASTVLETLTRGALATGDGLRMVGDVAAGTNQPIGELSVWFGRLYDGVMSGRPVGEAMMRMQELGIVTGETRAKVESMIGSGQKGSAVWNVLTGEFARFGGMMDKLSGSWGGLLSNLRDSTWQLKASIGAVLLPMAKKTVDGLSKLLIRTKDFVDAHPGLTKALGLGTIAFGATALAAGGAAAAIGSVIGFSSLLSYSLDVVGVKLGMASLRMKSFAVASRLAGGGVRGTALALLTNVRGVATKVLPWMTGLLGAGGIAGIGTWLTGIGAALAAIPGIGWIAAGIVAAGVLIWKFWEPLKALFGGFWDGFIDKSGWVMEVVGQLKGLFGSLFKVALLPLKALWAVVGNLIAPTQTGTKKMEAFGVVVGKVFGAVNRVVSLPLQALGHFAEKISGVLDWLIGKAEKVIGWIGKASAWIGGNGKKAAAATALAAAPIMAADSPEPLRASGGNGDTHYTNQITIHAMPGMDERALAKMVQDRIDQANRENARRARVRNRGRLSD